MLCQATEKKTFSEAPTLNYQIMWLTTQVVRTNWSYLELSTVFLAAAEKRMKKITCICCNSNKVSTQQTERQGKS